jgi:DNA-binding MarR family transcriptional regulator
MACSQESQPGDRVMSAEPCSASPDDQTLFGDSSPQHAYYRLFFALQRVARTIMPDIERALHAEGIADPVWYEILLAAEEAGTQGVQMLTLQRRLFVRQYALSRHVARMERVGLIRRVSVPGAGRGQTVHLTEAAQGLQHRLWAVYSQRIEAAVADRLTPAEAYAALRLVNRLYG